MADRAEIAEVLQHFTDNDLLQLLTFAERVILRQRVTESAADVAHKRGITVQAIRRVEEQALTKLKAALATPDAPTVTEADGVTPIEIGVPKTVTEAGDDEEDDSGVDAG